MSLQNDHQNLSPHPTTPSKIIQIRPLSGGHPPVPDKSSFINIRSFLSSGLQHPFLPTLARQPSPNTVEFLPPQNLDDGTFTSKVQDILKNANKQTPHTSRHTPNTVFTPREPMSARLREKRLSDIQIYKQRNSKGNIEMKTQEDESPSNLKKSFSSSQLKRPARTHTRQSSLSVGKKVDFSRISERRLATVVPADISSLALLTENPRINTEGTPTNIQRASDPILSIENVSYPQKQPLQVQMNTPSYQPKEWKEYTERANSPTIDRSETRKLRRNLSTGSIVKFSSSQERLQTFKPLYQQFITENFKPKIVDRLDTLANFGFNTIEKDENVEVPEFLNNTSKMNPGSMAVVDLFSKNYKTRVMKTADLMTAKRTVKKFLVHCADKIKPPSSRGPIVGASFETQDGNAKSRLAAKELAKQHMKHQEEELMSPMRRHLSMKSKTFYKDTQSNRERTINIISVSGKAKVKPSSKLTQGIDGIMHNLDKLEQETQDDYIKVLKFSDEYDAKYPPPVLKANYEMRKLHNLLTVENRANPDRISEKDSEEGSVLV